MVLRACVHVVGSALAAAEEIREPATWLTANPVSLSAMRIAVSSATVFLLARQERTTRIDAVVQTILQAGSPVMPGGAGSGQR